jgi:hypothetical protein
MKLRYVMWILLLPALAVLISACAGQSKNNEVKLTLAPLAEMPDFVKDSPPQVQEAYRFAVANPTVLDKFPCYCGCGAMGHQNNLQCYVKEARAGDSVLEFDNHATGCTICVDITRDVMRLLREEKDLKEIRTYIDTEYSKYGPSTNTEPIAEQGQAECNDQADTCGNDVAAVSNPIDLNSVQVLGPVSETAND